MVTAMHMRQLLVGGFSILLILAASAQVQASEKPLPDTTHGRVGDRATKVILLGTAGGPIIRAERSQPSSALLVNGRVFLIDSGAGTVSQLAKAGIQPPEVTRIFLTHLHLDHVADVAPLIAFDWVSNQRQPVEIYGPPGTASFVASGLNYLSIQERLYSLFMPPHPRIADIVGTHDIDVDFHKPQIIYQDADVRVTAARNSHYSATAMTPQVYGVDKSYSYRFDTPNRSIVFTGDTGRSADLVALANGADVLVSEVLDLDAVTRYFRQDFKGPASELEATIKHMTDEHLSPQEVGKIAQEARVKMVVLTHLSVAPGKATHLVEAVQSTFSGPVIEGKDLDIF